MSKEKDNGGRPNIPDPVGEMFEAMGHKVVDVTPTNQETPEPTQEKCEFCSMTFPDNEVLNIEPLNPVVAGHRIFIPKEHVQDFADNEHVTIKTMYVAQQYAKKIGGDFNIITSKGKCATQSVFHLHVHFVPRKENDGLHLPWTNQHTPTAAPDEEKHTISKMLEWEIVASRLQERKDTLESVRGFAMGKLIEVEGISNYAVPINDLLDHITTLEHETK